MSTDRFAVIGAGLAGAATAWRLAADGHDVTVLERTVPANDWGSSHGSARIFRYAYPDPFYADLVRQARDGWDELADRSGRRLLTTTGAVDFGAERNPRQLADVLGATGIDHELVDRAQAAVRWPGFDFDTPVLWHRGAAVIDAQVAVQTMLDLAIDAGAVLRTDWPVARIAAADAAYRIRSETGEELESEHVIVSAGGWLPDLLPDLPVPDAFLASFPALEVRQEQAYHFPYREPSNPAAWPTFIYKSADVQVYGLPGGRDAGGRGQKVAVYNGGRRIPSAAQHDRVLDPVNRDRVVDFVRRFLPGLVPEPYAETTCLFTNTPSEDFVIDRAGGITLLSPCSGHGAKFAPLIGRLAADLATGRSDVPARFRPSVGIRPRTSVQA